jgi:hypothetical protein
MLAPSLKPEVLQLVGISHHTVAPKISTAGLQNAVTPESGAGWHLVGRQAVGRDVPSSKTVPPHSSWLAGVHAVAEESSLWWKGT